MFLTGLLLPKLKKYASMYGFNRKSGVEITEYEPHISDEDAIRSAIGQGTHSYTPSQISRYVTSLVNHKNLIDSLSYREDNRFFGQCNYII